MLDFQKLSTNLSTLSKVAIVIPALNEEKGIGDMIDQLKDALQHHCFNIVVVDGYSTDNTKEIALEKGATVIAQPKKGYGDALKAGFSYACDSLNADVVVMADADCTYDAYDIPELIQPIISDKSDLVVGNRFDRMDSTAMSFLNKFGNKILSLVANLLLGVSVSDTQCGLRAMNARFLKQVKIDSDGMSFATQMLSKLSNSGARISEVPISYHVRKGKTKMKRFTYGFEILRVIFSEALSHDDFQKF